MATTTAAMTDEEIKNDVEEQLYWDNRVDSSNIGITVDDGEVTLNGTVPTYFARDAAVADALSIVGVTEVDNELSVRYPAGVSTPTDSEIESNVESVLRINPDIDTSDVEVDVSEGIVTLEGAVDAYWKKVHAEEMASNVSGVLSIDNRLNVIRAKDFVDREIAGDIADALDRNALLDAEDIDITVEDGVVMLTGTVPTRTARQAAYDAARYTLGVVDVRNNLVVESTA